MDLIKDATDYCCGIFSLFHCVHISCTVSSMGSKHVKKDDLMSRSPQAEGNVVYFLLWI